MTPGTSASSWASGSGALKGSSGPAWATWLTWERWPQWAKVGLITSGVLLVFGVWLYLAGGIFLMLVGHRFEEARPLTLYQYGYLRFASDLCFWKRELVMADNAVTGATATPPGCFFP